MEEKKEEIKNEPESLNLQEESKVEGAVQEKEEVASTNETVENNNISSTKPTEEENKDFVDKNKNLKIVLVIVLLLLGLGLIGGGFYYAFFMRATPENFLTKVSTSFTNLVDNSMQGVEEIKIGNTSNKKNIKSTGSIEFNLDDKNNKLQINYDGLISTASEAVTLDLDLLANKESLLKGALEINKDTIYANLKDTYNKPIRLLKSDGSLFELFKDTTIKSKSLKDYIDSFADIFKYYVEALQEADMKTENISFSEVKYSYEVNAGNVAKVQAKFKELCEKDATLKDLLGTSIDDFISDDSNFKIEYTVNRFSNKLKQFTGIVDETSIEITADEKDDSKFYLTIKAGDVTSEYTLTMTDEKITIKDTKDSSSVIEIDLQDGFGIKMTSADADFDISLKKTAEKTIRLALKVEDKSTTKTTVDLNVDMKFSDDGSMEMDGLMTISSNGENFEMKLNMTVSYTDTEPKVSNYSNAIDIDKIPESDLEGIYEKIGMKLLNTGLLNSLMDMDSNQSL